MLKTLNVDRDSNYLRLRLTVAEMLLDLRYQGQNSSKLSYMVRNTT